MNSTIYNYINKYFNNYMSEERDVSKETVITYKYCFRLLFQFIELKCSFKLKNFSFNEFTKQFVLEYLNWLETEMKNSIASRNLRLQIIKSFTSYVLQFEFNNPELVRILSIPRKKEIKKQLAILSKEQISLLISQPDINLKKGRRELAILVLLYDSAMRINEFLNVHKKDINFDGIKTITIYHGKGNKRRTIPISDNTAAILRQYIKDYDIKDNDFMFFNSKNEKLCSNAIRKIINKNAVKANIVDNSFPLKLHPHLFRHSKASHLIEDGITDIEVKDFLGHASLESTQIYITTNILKKRNALETIEFQILENHKVETKNDNIIDEYEKCKETLKI